MIDEEVLLEKLEELIEYDTFDYAQEEPKIVMSFEELEKIIVNQPKVGEWIPCSERLPEDEETKIVTLSDGKVEGAFWNERNWWCMDDSINLEVRTEDVIAWMPLPPAYKGE